MNNYERAAEAVLLAALAVGATAFANAGAKAVAGVFENGDGAEEDAGEYGDGEGEEEDGGVDADFVDAWNAGGAMATRTRKAAKANAKPIALPSRPRMKLSRKRSPAMR